MFQSIRHYLAMLIAATLVLCAVACTEPPGSIRSIGRASPDAAAAWGYWVDHPDRKIPSDHPCNCFAEANLARLLSLGYPAYFVVAWIPALGEGHIMAAVDLDRFTVVWDSLHPDGPVTADDLKADGYVLIGREIDGIWYEVR